MVFIRERLEEKVRYWKKKNVRAVSPRRRQRERKRGRTKVKEDGMLQRLHVQMTIFAVMITGGILALMTLACLWISEKGIWETELASFTGNARSCLSVLEEEGVVSRTWMGQVLENDHIQMELWDNGKPLFHEDLPGSGKRTAAFEEAARRSREEEGLDVENAGVVSRRREAFFQMEGSYVCTALIPREGGMLTGILIYDRQEQRERLFHQRMAVGGAAALAFLALLVFSWFFTGRLIRPVEESRKRQTEFLAAASHELRSPLAVLLSSVQAMEGAQEQERKRFQQNMEREIRRMSRLVQDMLSLANADNHSWEIALGEQELDTLLLSAAEAFEPVMREKGIRLFVELPQKAVSACLCDGARITQVLSVFLDNGASYVPKGGQIRLELVEERDRFLIRVEDDGPGIPRESREEIFQRFYRADRARRDKQHFGLGLSIAQEIARLHGGSIRAGASPLGGAAFTLTLPKRT